MKLKKAVAVIPVLECMVWIMLVTFSPCDGAGNRLNIGSFNIQVFGRTKVAKPNVVDVLVKIIRRYDIVLLQEIRDSTGTAIVKLLDEVNKAGNQQYGMTISNRLGRTSSKEQYAFLYKLEADITVKDTYQYPDPGDIFEREPYSVLFHVGNAEVKEFVLVAIHAAPGEAVKEINQLSTVHTDLVNHWKNDNILILGDFNADCSYVTKTEMNSLLLLQDSTFHWWIPNDADTTVSGTDCAYDRFVMSGRRFIDSVIDKSATVFYFDKEYGLDLEFAKTVSDHYPIEIAVNAGPQVISQATPTVGRGILHTIKKFITRFNIFARNEL